MVSMHEFKGDQDRASTCMGIDVVDHKFTELTGMCNNHRRRGEFQSCRQRVGTLSTGWLISSPDDAFI